MEQDEIKKLKADLVVADQVNGRLIRTLKEIHAVVIGSTEDDGDARYRVLEILESESSLTLD